MAQDFNQLLQALQDPAQKEMLATKAAANGPPPDTSTFNMPAVPGVTPPPAPNPQLYSGLAGIGQQPGQDAGNVEENKSKWMEFMDNLTNPEGPALPLLQMGAKLLQPRYGGQTQAGRIGEGLADFGNFAAAQRAQQKKGQLEERKVTAQEQLAGAEVQKAGAQTESIQRETESADIMDYLATARAELAIAQAQGTRNEGQEKIIYDQMMANVLYKNNPDKYATPEEALEKWAKFKIDKGDTPEAQSLTQLMENLPYLPPERVDSTLNTIKGALEGVGGIEAGPSVEWQQDLQRRAEELRTRVPADKVTDEQWLRFETTLKDQRTLAEEAYGKDVVEQKIREAKARQGQ